MTNDLMTTFLEFCDPFREEIPGDISEDSWTHISELSKLHGVTPFLYYRTRSLGLKLPDQIEREWLGHYLYQIAEEKKARRQIRDLKEILAPEGIPFILLKGASAMLRLYPQPGLRTFVDLDILIPSDTVSRFKQTMTKAGYKPLASRNSPEDEDLRKFDDHLDPFWKEGRVMVEPHLSILGARGDHLLSLPEMWEEIEDTKVDGILVSHLSKEHFLIHMFLHWVKDVSNNGFVPAKGFIDVLYAVKTWGINWSKITDISRRWGVDREVLPLMATLNHYWEVGIPLPGTPEPLDLNNLVLGVEDREKENHEKVPAIYIKRLLKIRELPNVASQVRYALHLLFPTRENLRWRYGLSSKWSIIPYYFIHLLVTLKKVVFGVWHQFFYRSKGFEY